jgi:endonuclease YncB( thermonuclease family)
MVDGNTIDTQYRNRAGETIRLLSVETTEISPSRTSPHGRKSTDHQLGVIGWPSVEICNRLLTKQYDFASDPISDQRGSCSRLLGYVYANRTPTIPFNMKLVKQKYARYYESSVLMS